MRSSNEAERLGLICPYLRHGGDRADGCTLRCAEARVPPLAQHEPDHAERNAQCLPSASQPMQSAAGTTASMACVRADKQVQLCRRACDGTP